MQAMFGNNWRNRFRTEKQIALALGEWAKGLEGVTLEDVDGAFVILVESGTEWPPSLPEFIALCRKSCKGLTHNTAAYREFKRSNLLTNKSSKERGKKVLEQIKAKLNA